MAGYNSVLTKRYVMIALVLIAALAFIAPIITAGQGAVAIINSLTKVAGVPVGSDVVTTTTTAPANTKVLEIHQAGQHEIIIARVKVVDTDAVLDSGMIKGFNISLEVKSAMDVGVRITVMIVLANGNEVSAEKVLTLNPGSSTVYVELTNPIDPDDVVRVCINATPV